MQIKSNVILSKYTTFRIGGTAKYFCVVKNMQELKAALKMAKEKNLPFFILGAGSNILVSDKGYEGEVINFQFSIFNKDLSKGDNFKNGKVIAGAGLLLRDLALKSMQAGLTGLEWVVGIPGTVGGGVYGNCGAHGHSISEFVTKVKTLNPITLKSKTYANKDCKFAYRESIFKQNKNIILEAEFKLPNGDKEESAKLIKGYLEYRKKGAPYPSAGSIFKNIFIDEKKISAGYLIDQCGLKGKIIGGAKIWENHANTFVNFNNAKTSDVVALINLCKREVKNKFDVDLQTEIQFIGF